MNTLQILAALGTLNLAYGVFTMSVPHLLIAAVIVAVLVREYRIECRMEQQS